ncbi:MAG: serine hydrolase domain-containing protein [Mucilaginibacter sp.]|uniref:serine hydrolase domain-containing protein n=1 Tax=Mucilaginibacter sp. TaxID=1882438 RepID=UPI0031A271C9
MKCKLLIVALMAVLFGQCTVAQTPVFNKAKMDSLMDILAANNKTMISLALRQNGQLIYSRAIGYSVINDKQKVAATTDTHYRIGSITKVFTSVMIFQLIEEGKLQLSTPLARYFPDIPNAAKITIAQMLNHSSGLHNFADDSSFLTAMNKKQTHADMLTIFKQNKPDFEPGTRQAYSNTGFVLLGYIIETIDKKPYALALKDRIVNKIALPDTYYGGKIDVTKQEAQSYNWQDSNWKNLTETDMSVPGGAGALVSNPKALTQFINALFTGKLVSDSSLNHMKNIKGQFGMDLMGYPFYSKTGFGHNGGIDGFQSQVVYFPEEKLATSYTANGVNMDLNDMMIGVLSIAFNRPYTLPDFTLRTGIKFQPEDLDKDLGVYSGGGLPMKITVTKKDATLIAQATGQSSFPLEPITANEFQFAPAGIVMVFDAAAGKLTLKQGGRSFVMIREK